MLTPQRRIAWEVLSAIGFKVEPQAQVFVLQSPDNKSLTYGSTSDAALTLAFDAGLLPSFLDSDGASLDLMVICPGLALSGYNPITGNWLASHAAIVRQPTQQGDPPIISTVMEMDPNRRAALLKVYTRVKQLNYAYQLLLELHPRVVDAPTDDATLIDMTSYTQ